MTSPEPNADLRPELLRGLEPYLLGGSAIVMVFGLIGGWAGQSWRLIAVLVFLQAVGNILLGNLTRRWKNAAKPRYTRGLWNWIATTTIILLVGGYPTPFWLAFLFGAIVSGVITDQIGIYLNTIFAAVALTIPQLPAGLDLTTAVGIGMQVSTLFIMGLITQKSASKLFFEHSRRHDAEANLRQSNDRLTFSVAQLERNARDINLLTEIGRMLQSCITADETYSVIGSYMPELFPSAAGAIFVYSPSRNDLEARISWGDFPEELEARTFTPDECWALRQGQLYQQDTARSGMRCHHIRHLTSAQYLCIPMMARGETLGVLHMQLSQDGSTKGLTTSARTIEDISSVAASVAEYVALALANQTLRETLRNQAIRDSLTGLFNRRYAEETLDREILRALRKQTQLSVTMLDIDRFKAFNDTYGHEGGDIVLQGLGAFLRARVRGEDVACRYGGEEFLIIMLDTSLETAQQRAEEIREGVKTLSLRYQQQFLGNITLSLGVAVFPMAAKTKEALLQAVDAALYQAKASGRDRVVAAANQS